MPTLSAIFKGVDEISSVFEKMASTADKMFAKFTSIETKGNSAFDKVTSGVEETAKAMNDTASSTSKLGDIVDELSSSAVSAAESTGSLADAGSKAENAMGDAMKAVDDLTKSTTAIEQAMDGASSTADNLAAAVDDTATRLDKQAEAVEESAASTEKLTQKTNKLEDGVGKLGKTYDTAKSKTEKTQQAAENLNDSVERLSKSAEQGQGDFEKYGESIKGAGDKAEEAASQMEQAFDAAAIEATLHNITDKIMDMADAYDNAQSIIAKATGASGAQLTSLSNSLMKVYSTAKTNDLSYLAGALSEVNDKFGLTGQRLEEATSLFLDFERVTGSDVTNSIGMVSRAMQDWGIDIKDTESYLDKLTYASMNSGTSVDQLASMINNHTSTLQAMGYELEESIALLANLQASGAKTEVIMKGFSDAVQNLTLQGKNAAHEINDVMMELESMTDSTERTQLAVAAFGKTAGTELANAMNEGKLSLGEWNAAIYNADGTLARTASTALTLGEKWTVSNNKITASLTKNLSPAINKMSGFLADIWGKVGDILNDSPVLTGLLTGLAAGVVALTAALAIYKTGVAISTAATALFGTTITAALGPVGLIIGAITLLVGAYVALSSAVDEQMEEYNSLSSVSKNHMDRVNELSTAYDNAVSKYGENSDAARHLSAELETAKAVFESTRMTVADFVAENDQLLKKHDQLVESFKENISSINAEEKSSMSLIAKLESLSRKTSLTAAEQQQMTAIVSKLNDVYPDLALSIDATTGSLNNSVDALREMAKAQAEQLRQEQMFESYIDAYTEREKLLEQIAIAEDNVAAAQERMQGLSWADTFSGKSKQATQDLVAFQAEQERLQVALGETESILYETEEAWNRQAEAMAQAVPPTISYEEAVSTAVQSVAEDIEKLAASYDEAYGSAYSAISGTIGLFKEMKTESELSVQDMIDNMNSQMWFMDTYMNNLKKAAEYGIDEGLIASLSDGSEQSAGYIDAIVKQIESLGGSTESMSTKAGEFVDGFNTKFQRVEIVKDQFASNIAEMQTGFSKGMDDIDKRMKQAIDDMAMEPEAAKAAKETIDAYIEQIKSMTASAKSAAEGVASAAASGLAAKGISTVGVAGHARGTTSAENVFVAGEQGPELIVGAEGSTVFPAHETQKILHEMSGEGLNVPPPQDMRAGSSRGEEKTINLEINGSGAIKIDKNVDPNAIWDDAAPRIKEILLGILRQEVYEEGDRAYAF